MVSELFVSVGSIGHLTYSKRLVNDNNASQNLQKERRMFCGPFFFLCDSFKLLVFKISSF